MLSDDYYDPDEDAFPRRSPLLQPVQVRIKPDTPDTLDDEMDLDDMLDLSIPWNPALRDPKRPRKNLRDPTWKDDSLKDWALIHHLSGYDPEIARTAGKEPLPPNEPDWRPPSFLRRPRKRRVLPLVLRGPLGATANFEACADSGSDENIISLEVARQMKLYVNPEGVKSFALANGKTVQAAGSVVLDCAFAVGEPLPSATVACVFYVFNTLAVPLIMGMGFLTMTETLSLHTDRLIEQVVSEIQALKVNSVGSAKCSAPCRLNDLAGYAVVDTGSDLNFVHPMVVTEGNFVVEPASVCLEFADCSSGMTSGVINTAFSIQCENQSERYQPLFDQQFFILDDLNTDILIGQETIENLQVMTSRLETLAIIEADSAVNIIRVKGKLEQRIRGIGKSLQAMLTTSGRINDTDTDREDSDMLQVQRENAKNERETEQLISQNKRENSLEEPQITSIQSGYHVPSFTAQCPVTSDTSSSPNNTYAPSIAATYDSTATSIIDRMSHAGQAYASETTGLYFCSFRGCPRSEGGKGFKRENEMIRHGLVHNSPGYICPFCPDREHKYPRPDNLQRHVRVHHPDKNRYDTALIAELQKSERCHRRRRPRPTRSETP